MDKFSDDGEEVAVPVGLLFQVARITMKKREKIKELINPGFRLKFLLNELVKKEKTKLEKLEKEKGENGKKSKKKGDLCDRILEFNVSLGVSAGMVFFEYRFSDSDKKSVVVFFFVEIRKEITLFSPCSYGVFEVLDEERESQTKMMAKFAKVRAKGDPALLKEMIHVINSTISGEDSGANSFIILRDLIKSHVKVNGKCVKVRGGFRGFKRVPKGKHKIQVKKNYEDNSVEESWTPEITVDVKSSHESHVFILDDDKLKVDDNEHYKRLSMAGSMNHALFEFPQ